MSLSLVDSIIKMLQPPSTEASVRAEQNKHAGAGSLRLAREEEVLSRLS